jgi:hypothetical protein
MSTTMLRPTTETVSPEELETWPVETRWTVRIDRGRSRVSVEAERLDRLFPGWENRVDISTLDMSEGRHCILGQAAYRKYWFWRRPIGYCRGLNIVQKDGHWSSSTAYCSNADLGAWINEINNRRATA